MTTAKQTNEAATAPAARARVSRCSSLYAEPDRERVERLLVDPAPVRTDEQVVLIREVLVRYRGPSVSARGQVKCSEDAVRFVRKVTQDDAREHVHALYLDAGHRPIAYQLISIGTATTALLHPREVFQPAILVGAVAVIVLHNHPSGDTTPSEADRQVTRQLNEAGTVLQIKLLDHIIWVSDGSFRSLVEEEPSLFWNK